MKQIEQLGIPLPGADIEQQRARRVGGVGQVRLAAGELPEQVRIDGAEGELAGFRSRACAIDMIEDPGDFRCREIGIEQPGALVDHPLVPRARQRRAGVMRAAVTPHDRIVDRLAGRAVPQDGGLALVGDADRRDILGGDVGARHRGARGRDRRGPDALRIVLDPAGLRIDLRKLELRDPTAARRSSNRNARVEVVPWSTASR